MGTTQLESVPEPKYWHLKTELTRALETEFQVGEVLPNERELAARFGVARATVRQALDQLELEGRLQRRRGVGTTVAPPRVGVDVSSAEPSWPGGPEDDWRSDSWAHTAPPAAVARLLGLPAGTAVHTLRRSRRSHGQPLATELLYVPDSSLPGLTAGRFLRQPTGAEPSRSVLAALHRQPLEGQDRSVELGSADADDARQLDRLPGAPVLVVTTRYFSAGGTAAVALSTYRADTCRLTFGDQGALPLAS